MRNQISEPVESRSASYSSGKFLTFHLGSESYGIEVLKIREIIRMQRITPVPRMPEHVKGVINLRGKVIPVIDLRLRLNLTGIESPERACVVVVDIGNSAEAATLLGLVVDAVQEVLNIDEEQIEPSPDFTSGLGKDCCLGIATRSDGGLMTLLDIDQVVSSETGDDYGEL